MQESDFAYGCHSGIQKAIRRSDLDLAKTCFDAMWSDKKHRSWLKWRLLSIVQEDVLPLVGELPEFFASIRGMAEAEEEIAWRKMVYRVTLAPKQKDAPGLIWSAWGSEPVGEEHPEMESMRKWLAMVREAKDDPSGVGADLYDHIVKDQVFGEMTSYEIMTLGLLKKRTGMGGMLSDRQISVAAMLLIAHRRLSKATVTQGAARGVKLYAARAGGRKPVTVNLPWYVFDMHTVAGKMAKTAFVNHHVGEFPGLDKSKFEDLWFMLESAFTPNADAAYCAIKSKPTIWENMWWPVLLKLSLPFGEHSAREVKDLWFKEIRGKVKHLVEWALDKRRD